MQNNELQFLDVKISLINHNIEYIVQYKDIKADFFIQWTSNHPQEQEVMCFV